MAVVKIKLLDFVNSLPEIKAGRIEILAAFIHWMEHTKKIVFATQEDFIKFYTEFKSL